MNLAQVGLAALAFCIDAQKQGLGALQAVLCGSAHVGERLKILFKGFCGLRHCWLGPSLAKQGRFNRCCAFRDPCHTAKSDARLGDPAVLDCDIEGAKNGGDVLVMAFGEFPHPEPIGLARQGDGFEEFSGAPILLAIGAEEIFKRDVAAGCALAQMKARAQGDQGGALSPMGEPLAILPPNVAAARIWGLA